MRDRPPNINNTAISPIGKMMAANYKNLNPVSVKMAAIMREQLPIREIMLMDIDEGRLDTMHGFSCRFARHL